jgi:hypothetical protein
MNILPKDIITYIYRIIHKLNIKELNSEFLNVSKVYSAADSWYWALSIKKYRIYNMRPINNTETLCKACKNDNILAHNKCIECDNHGRFYEFHDPKLPKRYIYSSGLTHPYAYKQRELIL